jgi:hypothetical protein
MESLPRSGGTFDINVTAVKQKNSCTEFAHNINNTSNGPIKNS